MSEGAAAGQDATGRARSRQPQQSRSRETVARILAAADSEIGELGLNGASTTSIARRAGVSVGGLYRFFADKEEIANALASQYLEDVEDRFTEMVASVASLDDIDATVALLVERANEDELAHPGYYRLTEERGPERLDSPAHAVRGILTDIFAAALVRAGVEDGPAVRTAVDLCLETVRHTLVHCPPDPAARAAVVAELRVLVTAYLRARLS